MKIDFILPNDKKTHLFCPKCHSERIQVITKNKRMSFLCKECGNRTPRIICINSKVVWWIDKKTKECWHESVGVFIFNSKNESLLFQRVRYPFSLTIPAGHLDVDELPKDAAKREVFEETGIRLNKINLFSEENISDKCICGADYHKWHLYIAKVGNNTRIKINKEGIKPEWLSLEEIKKRKLTYAVRYFIRRYGDKLFS